MTRYRKTAPLLFLLIGLIFVIRAHPTASERIGSSGLSNFLQHTFKSNGRTLDELDDEFLEEILPSVSLVTNRGDVLQASSLTCNICNAIASRVKEVMMLNITQKVTVEQGILICTVLRIQSHRVCSEIIPKFGPWAMTVLAHSVFSAENLCSKAHLCPKPDTKKPEVINLPEPQPVKTRVTTGERLWMIHLSDWHYDPEYKEGYEVNCGEPICCRPPNAFGDKAKSPAGKWGDYNCEVDREYVGVYTDRGASVGLHRVYWVTPILRLLTSYVMGENMLTIYLLDSLYRKFRDLPPHDVWSETQSSIMETTNQTASIWHRFFTSTPFFPIIGNHESAPVNSFPTSSIGISSVSWLYDTLATQWNGWLSPNTLRSIEQKGFYSTRLPKDNLRIIGLNTNFWYKFNWWMLMRPREEWDPEWMLKWMVEQLHEAESLGEKHMSAVDLDAFPSFGVYYSQIVTRFKDTIVGQFYGHSHWDEFQVIYDVQTTQKEPVGVAYLAPSVTSFKNMNPAFRLYEIDKSTKQIVNHYTYSMDLRAANRDDKPEWKLLYDAKSLYGLEDLQPKSWHDLTERFIHDESTYKTFQRMASRDQHLNKYGSCRSFESQQQCRNRIICKLRGTFPRHGPFRDDELCKKQSWFPHLPEEWFLSATMGKHINVMVDLDKVDADELSGKNIKIKVKVDGLVEGQDEGGDEEDIGGVTFEGLPKTIVRLVMGLVMGGDDVVCR
ncbi:15455_t:CDS:2 [Acaulospora colombiana]|uniref:15455_t:CDS:1 n=1 Tax=Acaulospora colombiana TaxID=27376 RepID=A0ACA9LDR1_9GLOM|nr:15455_t:CDS:2 [Acaulospora colombiana]